MTLLQYSVQVKELYRLPKAKIAITISKQLQESIGKEAQYVLSMVDNLWQKHYDSMASMMIDLVWLITCVAKSTFCVEHSFVLVVYFADRS